MKMIRKRINFSLGERSVYVKKTFLANSQRIADFGNQKSLAGYVVQKPNNPHENVILLSQGTEKIS